MLVQKKIQKPESPTVYPPGCFVHTELGYFYIASPSKRYRLISKRILDSWSPFRVIETTEAAVSKYRIAAKLRFRNNSLIKNVADGRIYLIVDGKRRQLVSPEAFQRLGVSSNEWVVVSQDEINLHELGEEIK